MPSGQKKKEWYGGRAQFSENEVAIKTDAGLNPINSNWTGSSIKKFTEANKELDLKLCTVFLFTYISLIKSSDFSMEFPITL